METKKFNPNQIYWNDKGKYQQKNEILDKIIEKFDNNEVFVGGCIDYKIAANMLYYDLYNNGNANVLDYEEETEEYCESEWCFDEETGEEYECEENCYEEVVNYRYYINQYWKKYFEKLEEVLGKEFVGKLKNKIIEIPEPKFSDKDEKTLELMEIYEEMVDKVIEKIWDDCVKEYNIQ